MNLSALFHGKKVVIVGDVMVDQYLSGQVHRVSPEAPVPVVELERKENRLGGAANVALNLKALGAEPILLSVTGQDDEREVFLQLLRQAGMTTDYILASANRPTTLKTRVMAANQHLLRIDREIKTDIGTEEAAQLIGYFKHIIETAPPQVVVFQDYNKGVLTKKLIHDMSKLAATVLIPTVVDPKFHQFYDYQGVHLFKPNLKEVRQKVPFPVKVNRESLLRAAQYIEGQLGNSHTMITLSEHGIFIKFKNIAKIVPTAPRKIVDVCGAGDAVISVAALCVAAGLSPEQTATIANIAGGQVCEQVGVVPVRMDAVEEEWGSGRCI